MVARVPFFHSNLSQSRGEIVNHPIGRELEKNLCQWRQSERETTGKTCGKMMNWDDLDGYCVVREPF